MVLLEHQRKAIENFNGYTYLAWETGTGKTLTALKIAERFNNVLILCPASVIQVWTGEIAKWNISLKNYKIVSYDTFRLHHQKILKERFWDFVIFDEAHKLKSIRAKITKLIMKIFSKSYKIMLSGTPFEKPDDYYTQLRILRFDHPFSEISYTQYKEIFFEVDTMFHYIKGFRPGIKEKFLQKYVLPYVWFLKRSEVVDLPSLIEDDKVFIGKSYLIQNGQIDCASNILQEFMFLYKKSALLKDKIDYVCDFVTDNPQTVVFSYFLEPIEQIVKRVGRDRVYVVTGKDKRELEYAIKYAEKPVIATYCISEGVNLNKYRNILFLSLPLAWRVYEQALSRIWRFGQAEKVYLVRLHDKNGIDCRVWNILKRKGDVLEELKVLGDKFLRKVNYGLE